MTLLCPSPDTSDRPARHDRRHRTACVCPCHIRTVPSAFFMLPLTLLVHATAMHVLAMFHILVYNSYCLALAKQANGDRFSVPLHLPHARYGFPRAFSVFRDRSLCALNPDPSPNSLAAWTFHLQYNMSHGQGIITPSFIDEDPIYLRHLAFLSSSRDIHESMTMTQNRLSRSVHLPQISFQRSSFKGVRGWMAKVSMRSSRSWSELDIQQNTLLAWGVQGRELACFSTNEGGMACTACTPFVFCAVSAVMKGPRNTLKL